MTYGTAFDWEDPHYRRVARWVGLDRDEDPIRQERKELRVEIASDVAFAEVVTHLLRAQQSGLDIKDPEVMRSALELGRQDLAATTNRWLSYAPLAGVPADVRNHPPIVYYARRGSTVKIGTTSNIRRRMYSVQTQGVLAIEPGDSLQEHLRHEQFHYSRKNGEWFDLTEDLIEHVASLREAFQTRVGESVEGWLAARWAAKKIHNFARRMSPQEPTPLPVAGEALLTSAMAARLVGISPQNFAAWRHTGKVDPVGKSPDGRNLFRASDVLASYRAASSRPGLRRKAHRHVA